MTAKTPTESFLHDVRDHQMKILRDDGFDRYIEFRRPSGGAYWFNVLTFRGYLFIYGDMGDYAFSRIDDMFEFFRTGLREEGKILINASYWAEKVQSMSVQGRIREFDPTKFRRQVVEHFREYTRDSGIVPGLKQEIRDYVLSQEHHGETECRSALEKFEHEWTEPTWRMRSHTFRFHDSWEWHMQRYTHSYIWICHAIVWSIMQYDKAKTSKTF